MTVADYQSKLNATKNEAHFFDTTYTKNGQITIQKKQEMKELLKTTIGYVR